MHARNSKAFNDAQRRRLKGNSKRQAFPETTCVGFRYTKLFNESPILAESRKEVSRCKSVFSHSLNDVQPFETDRKKA
jgi:hypothetical protein